MSEPNPQGHPEHEGHGTRRGYLVGFALSSLLTAVPFWLVMSGVLGSANATAAMTVVFAALQIAVHTHFFLHVTTRAEGGWTLMTLAFTAVVLVIVISGSVWIMYHINGNMMPTGEMPGM